MIFPYEKLGKETMEVLRTSMKMAMMELMERMKMKSPIMICRGIAMKKIWSCGMSLERIPMEMKKMRAAKMKGVLSWIPILKLFEK